MNKSVGHPSEFVPGLADVISRSAKDAEQLRTLHPEQLAIIYRQRWLKMFMPEASGGLQLSLPEGVRIEEGLSWADGSTGWVVTLCSGAGWFAGFLPEGLMKAALADDRACVAGSGAPSGTAEIVDDGYEVSGHWKYASGSLLATLFTANCVITKGGKAVHHPDGTLKIRAFIFSKDDVKVKQSWSAMGMIATGSHEFEIFKLPVPADRCFIIDPRHAVLKHPLYQYPFLQLAETTLAANLSGMAVRFKDLCEPLFEERKRNNRYSDQQRQLLSQRLSEAHENFSALRHVFYDCLDASWEVCSEGNKIPETLLNEVSLASHALARASRQTVGDLYPLCGLVAANSDSEINRVWRNLHTAAQHELFRFD